MPTRSTLIAEPNSRRAVLRSSLGAIAGVSALALPVVANAITPSPDAELFALQPEIDAADRLAKEANDALNRLEAVYEAATPPEPVPEPVRPTPFPVVENDQRSTAERVTAAVEQVRVLYAERDARHDREWLAWNDGCLRLAEECGLTAANDRAEEADHRVMSLADKLATTRATTLAGLIFKARHAAAHFPGDRDEEVTASIVDDLLAMDDEKWRVA
jgi:hypothetical protein